MDRHGQLSRVEVTPGAIARAGQCILCGQPASQRLDAVVAPFVRVERPTLPYCEAHARDSSARWVRVTVLLAATRLAPIVAGYLAGRAVDTPAWSAALSALLVAAACFPLERALVQRWRPLARIIEASPSTWTLAVEGQPPKHFSPGGPSARSGRALLDRTPFRPAIPAFVALLGAFIGYYQWHEQRPTLYIDNPSEREVRVALDGQTTTVQAGTWTELTLRAGSHRVVIYEADTSVAWTLTVQPGVDMLLASRPHCYEIDRRSGSPLSTRGQLFSLDTGGWQRVNCSSN